MAERARRAATARVALGAAIGLAASLAGGPAGARELWSCGGGASALEARAYYKTLATGLRLPGGLVEGAEALAALVAGTPVPPRTGATSAHAVRAWGRLLVRERLELEVGWQATALVASHPALALASALAGGVSIGGAGRASRRLLDVDPVLVAEGGLLVQHDVDRLAVRLRTSRADVIAGRQVLSWGSGRLWNPTDLLSPFAPTDLDREVRRGVDALRVSVPLAAAAQLELLWLPQASLDDQGGVARAQVNVRGFDLAPSLAKYVRDLVAGLDATGDLGPLGVHAEAAWTRALDRDAAGARESFVRAVAGLDWRPTEKLALTGEMHFNGHGTSDPDEILAALSSARVRRGEVFGAGRHYAGLVAAWQASDLLGVQATAIANVTDPSAILVPALEVWAEQSVLVRAGGVVPLGRRPDPARLQALTPADVASQSEAFREATRAFGLQSEYGSSPWGVFVQVGLYL